MVFRCPDCLTDYSSEEPAIYCTCFADTDSRDKILERLKEPDALAKRTAEIIREE